MSLGNQEQLTEKCPNVTKKNWAKIAKISRNFVWSWFHGNYSLIHKRHFADFFTRSQDGIIWSFNTPKSASAQCPTQWSVCLWFSSSFCFQSKLFTTTGLCLGDRWTSDMQHHYDRYSGLAKPFNKMQIRDEQEEEKQLLKRSLAFNIIVLMLSDWLSFYFLFQYVLLRGKEHEMRGFIVNEARILDRFKRNDAFTQFNTCSKHARAVNSKQMHRNT